ncbi:MAG: MarR family transcriptional regulator [Ruminococcaceae bacterium]|nr:MarR family transcriptional regulator [Oscillospiraceae bacterium]
MLDRFEQFSGFISGIYRSIQKLERDEMVKYGLKGAYAQYLVVMNRFKEGITAAKLGEICDKDKAAVSRIITNMEKKGLITRKGQNNNLYRALLFLTEEGKKAADYVSQRAKIAVEKAGAGLDESERTKLYTALGIISSNLQSITKAGIPEQ